MSSEVVTNQTTCCVCGANIDGAETLCPFCGASNQSKAKSSNTQKSASFFRRKKRNIEPEGTPFFNPSVNVKERMMAGVSYVFLLFIIPLVYYKKTPSEKTDFIAFHVNQGMINSVLFVITVILSKVYEIYLIQMNHSIFNLMYTIITMLQCYLTIVFILSMVCILRGKVKSFPILDKITLFK